MFPPRGPARRTATPANVQCQKCLQRGHYSYECKETLQDRPYKARPSRTQLLRNPKLQPKLAGDTPIPFQNKKGVADAELAKREAESARKRDLEADDDDEHENSHRKRRRSASFSSASSVSRRSLSPPPARSGTAPRRERSRDSRDAMPELSPRRRRPMSSGADDYRHPRKSSGKMPMRDRTWSRSSSRSRSRSLSPVSGRRPSIPNSDYADRSHEGYRGRQDSRSPASRRGHRDHRRRDGGTGWVEQPESSEQDGRRRTDRDDDGDRRRKDHDANIAQKSPRVQRRQHSPGLPAPRERSLSPFSKRMAMTQAMNRR